MIHQGISGGQSVVMDTRLARVYRMKKGVMTTARLVNDRLAGASIRWRPIMVTLTYANPDGWRPEHVAEFLNTVRKWAKRRGYTLPYVWVMELTKKGTPHYHVLFWIPARLHLPKSDRRGWWPHGSTNTIRVRNSVGYVAKYASKFESKDGQFPKGARLHGIGGLTGMEKRVVAWWKLPKRFRTGEEGSVVWRRIIGGGWRCLDDGTEVKPSFVVHHMADSPYVMIEEGPEIDDYMWAYRRFHAENRLAMKKAAGKNWRPSRNRIQQLEDILNIWLGNLVAANRARRADWHTQLQTYRAQWLCDRSREGFPILADVANLGGLSLEDQIAAIRSRLPVL